VQCCAGSATGAAAGVALGLGLVLGVALALGVAAALGLPDRVAKNVLPTAMPTTTTAARPLIVHFRTCRLRCACRTARRW
jgi:hypothetical protein